MLQMWKYPNKDNIMIMFSIIVLEGTKMLVLFTLICLLLGTVNSSRIKNETVAEQELIESILKDLPDYQQDTTTPSQDYADMEVASNDEEKPPIPNLNFDLGSSK